MNKTISYKSTYMFQLFKPRNTAITNDERNRAALIMYENYICKYKAILLQCERDYNLMINVRLYQEIVVPNSKSNMVNSLLLHLQGAEQTKCSEKFGKHSFSEVTGSF